MLGFGAGLSVLLSVFSYTGGRFMGTRLDDGVDEVSRKEYLRKNRRRPIEEIVNELGEGRGVYRKKQKMVLLRFQLRKCAIRRIRIALTRYRYLRPRLRATKSGAHQGEIRHRGASIVLDRTWCTSIDRPRSRLGRRCLGRVHILTNAEIPICQANNTNGANLLRRCQ